MSYLPIRWFTIKLVYHKHQRLSSNAMSIMFLTNTTYVKAVTNFKIFFFNDDTTNGFIEI